MRDCRGIASRAREAASLFRQDRRTRANNCARLAREGVEARGNRVLVKRTPASHTQPGRAALENVRSQ